MNRRSSRSAVLALILLTACMSWQRVAPTDVPVQVVPGESVRITTCGGEQASFVVQEVDAQRLMAPSRSYAIEEIERVEVRRFSAWRTLGAVVLYYAFSIVMSARSFDW